MQYKLKHETLAKICNRNIMKIGKRFRKKRRRKSNVIKLRDDIGRKRLMKKRTMYILCLSAVVTVCTFKAFAASYHEPIQVEGPTINVDADSEVQAQQYVDFKFKGLKNGQHIILVKDGGYLLNEDGSDVGKSDLQDGDRIITVKQAKEIEKASYLEDED